jgi:hypothetical protein
VQKTVVAKTQFTSHVSDRRPFKTAVLACSRSGRHRTDLVVLCLGFERDFFFMTGGALKYLLPLISSILALQAGWIAGGD